jgi:predicted transcriptional regulator
MTETTSISVRLPAQKAVTLNQLAQYEERSRNYVINVAIDDYIEKQRLWNEGIFKAIKEAEEGLLHPAHEVFEEIRREFWK